MPAGHDLAALEQRIGYQFRDVSLLRRALTHKSRAFETSSQQPERLHDNEQLEFLGDSILGFLISEMLVSGHPDFPEGRLSKLKAWLVSALHLHEVATRIDLGDWLLLGRGEELSGGREKRALLSDAIEAVLAAIYLDGGIEASRRFVLEHVARDVDGEGGATEPLITDHKSCLQETAQARGLPMPRYVLVKESGPEHRKMFTVEARIGHKYAERAEGASKKAAGQKAARLVLDQLQGESR